MAGLRRIIVGRFRKRLEERGYPRLQMALLVALTGGAGFLCSTALLRSGFDAMWLRYLISVGAAYVAFLVLLWLWMRVAAGSFVDPRDLAGLTSANPRPDDDRRNRYRDDSPSLPDAVDFELELALPLLVIAFVGTLLVASLYIVYAAPLLFAELILDGVLAATLYRRLRTLDTRYWLETAVRRTYWTFTYAGVLLAIAGFAMEHYVPGAKSIGEVMAKVW